MLGTIPGGRGRAALHAVPRRRRSCLTATSKWRVMPALSPCGRARPGRDDRAPGSRPGGSTRRRGRDRCRLQIRWACQSARCRSLRGARRQRRRFAVRKLHPQDRPHSDDRATRQHEGENPERPGYSTRTRSRPRLRRGVCARRRWQRLGARRRGRPGRWRSSTKRRRGRGTRNGAPWTPAGDRAGGQVASRNFHGRHPPRIHPVVNRDSPLDRWRRLAVDAGRQGSGRHVGLRRVHTAADDRSPLLRGIRNFVQDHLELQVAGLTVLWVRSLLDVHPFSLPRGSPPRPARSAPAPLRTPRGGFFRTIPGQPEREGAFGAAGTTCHDTAHCTV
jgi:hypothetical protein